MMFLKKTVTKLPSYRQRKVEVIWMIKMLHSQWRLHFWLVLVTELLFKLHYGGGWRFMTIRHRGRTLSMSNQIILNNRNCYTRGTYILLSTSIDQTKLQNIIRFRTEIWRHISNQNRTLIIGFLHTGFNDLFLYFEKQLNIVFCYDTWWLAILRFRDCGYYELFDSVKWSQVAVKKIFLFCCLTSRTYP